MIITLTIYLLSILYIIFKSLYYSIKFFNKDFSIFSDFILIHSIPFYFNISKINLFSIFLNVLFIGFNFIILIPIFYSSFIFCQGDIFDESTRSNIYFKKNSEEIIKYHQESSNLHEKINKSVLNYKNKNTSKIILESDQIGKENRLDNYKVQKVERKTTIYNSSTGEFSLAEKKLGAKYIDGPESTKMYTERAIKRYEFFIKQQFNKCLKYDMSQTTDPYLNMKDIAQVLVKTPYIINNLIIQGYKHPEPKISGNYDPEIRIYQNEVSKLITPTNKLFKEMGIYLDKNVKHKIDQNKSPRFFQDLTSIYEIYKLSSNDMKTLTRISNSNGVPLNIKHVFIPESLYKNTLRFYPDWIYRNLPTPSKEISLSNYNYNDSNSSGIESYISSNSSSGGENEEKIQIISNSKKRSFIEKDNVNTFNKRKKK